MPRAKCSLADWQRAEPTFGRKIPLAWIEFVQGFGGGRICLRQDSRIRLHDASPTAQKCHLNYEETSCTFGSFDADIYHAGACRHELANYYYDDALALKYRVDIGSYEDWIEIGSSLSGDSLHIRSIMTSDAPETSRPSEGEVAWYDHEVSLFVYRWPTVESFLQCLDEMNQHAVQLPTREEEVAAQEAARREIVRQKGANKPVRRVMKHVTGAVSCTHCNSTFFPDDKNRWDGERCLSCGGPLIID